jgi:lipoate-protein ligase A
MDLVTTAHPDNPALDMTLTRAVLEAVARATAPETVRVFRPGAAVAFGRMDRNRPGFPAARRAARARGRTPLVRLGGGHAAAYDRDCVLMEVVRAQPGVIGRLDERFLDLVSVLQDALARAAVEVEIGELPGEYCPGRFSLHLQGGPKVAGVAQRVISGASLTTAVLVVGGGDSLRATISDVYAALDLPVDTQLAGALSDRYPDVSVELILSSILDVARQRYRAATAPVGAGVLRRAEELTALHQ